MFEAQTAKFNDRQYFRLYGNYYYNHNNIIILSPLVYSELISTGHFEEMSQTVDEEEHSIEMHLPYVAKVMESRRGQYTIVPILVGALSEEKEIFYGKLLSKYLADPDNLFVISSDFCHWGELSIIAYTVEPLLLTPMGQLKMS